MIKEKQKQICVLIDCDNISPYVIDNVFRKITQWGDIVIKQAYGNWSDQRLKSWLPKLNKNSITPIIQMDYVKGKNATDQLITTDAMEIHANRDIDAFIIISSDSDFAVVSTRLISYGHSVIGIGEKKTPKSFQLVCNSFYYVEDFQSSNINKEIKSLNKNIIKHLINAVHETQISDGWSNVAAVGNHIKKNYNFSHKDLGYKKLIDLFKDIDNFEVKYDENSLTAYIKVKRMFKFKDFFYNAS